MAKKPQINEYSDDADCVVNFTLYLFHPILFARGSLYLVKSNLPGVPAHNCAGRGDQES